MIIPYNALALPLDQLKDAPAAAAYGLRRLKSGYKGAPIRVRRSNDNAEMDIPFCGQDLCVSTLLAFVTTNSGFVTTWYDQSGNAYNVTQTTEGSQPRIVNAGVLDVDANGKPKVYFGSGKSLANTSVGISNLCSLFTVAKYDAEGVSRRMFIFGDATLGVNSLIGAVTDLGNYVYGQLLPEARNVNVSVDSMQSNTICSYTRSTTSLQQLWKNGTSVGTNVLATTTWTATRLEIGTGVTSSWLGDISEFIIFSTPLSDAQRQKLEKNQGRYFNLSVA